MANWSVIFEGVDSSSLSDAMNMTNTMSPSIKPLDYTNKVIGPAFTVKCYPDSTITVHKALIEAPKGSVIVISGENEQTSALFGEMMALDAKSNGIAGIVIDGYVRDSKKITAMNYPVFAKSVTSKVGSNLRIGDLQVPIVCGNINVSPGDIIFGDYMGVTVLPKDNWETVLNKAKKIEEKETANRKRMESGERLIDITERREIIYD